ncbi:helix-turn-helix transcriptional regulator [Pseudomonas sp. ABC1]|uniref:AraC family transcriptional regulator n=1 Tax=Pseudomonas sp. ABC1 TaxID=2748080 RepID=UPI0015C38D2B|nr:AraC family transcriptional regulator [Pseudomonas sp. ABC1]QLF92629.1 helix-turn-helix transcriptional regulator [Pseudomonas sp. ABC1]
MSASTRFWRDPAMPHVESRRACHSRACYKAHSHPTFSIGAIDQGRSRFSGAGSVAVPLQAGTLVFVPAERVHACNPDPDTAWSYQMLHLDAAWLRGVRQEYLQDEASSGEPVRILSDKALYTDFCRLNTVLFSQAEVADKEAALIEFIGDSDRISGLSIDASASVRQSGRLDAVLALLRREPAVARSLDELADAAGMSRYRLLRAFRARTGMTPHAWQVNQRINVARDLLQGGQALAQVALHLGFADQAHFQRAFKAHTGVTPGLYRCR